MPPLAGDRSIRDIKNKVVRGQLLKKEKREKAQAKLKKRIARKEAENRGETVEKGWTRTIENTREWLGDDDEWADPRTRPAPVEVDPETGDVRVDLGTLSNLFPANASTVAEAGVPARAEPKMLITTSPGKPPAPFTTQFLTDLQNLMGGKGRADVVPRRSPKFELGKVARWAKARGYGAIAVVGEDHKMPTSLTLSLLPYGPTAHFRLSGISLCSQIQGHAKPTSHPPELVLNHFSTPLGLSLASLLSRLFLPPSAAEKLAAQGYAGRQVVLAQNSRDFVFIRRYRYMFALKGERLGSKKKVGLERQQRDPDDDEVIKTRFQEMGPRMTVKMRWLRRGPLGETGDERQQREKVEKEQGTEEDEFGEQQGGDAREGADDEAEAADERAAAEELGIDENDELSQPNFDFNAAAKAAEAEAEAETEADAEADAMSEDDNAVAGPSSGVEQAAKRERGQPRKRTKRSHPLLRPPSSSPEPEFGHQMETESAPLAFDKKGRRIDSSKLGSVGKTWHAGRGEGGTREGKKRQEWGWEAKMQVSRRKFFL